jgi:hypothetical protein
MDEILIILRGIINDLSEPYEYTDERLQRLVCINAVLLLRELTFQTAYTINLQNNTITPFPLYSSPFTALVSLKTACMIASGEHKDAAKKSIYIKDGPGSIDTKEMAIQLGRTSKTVCDAYEEAKLNYQYGDGSAGQLIVGPYSNGISCERKVPYS